MVIEAAKHEGNTYQDVRIKTGGFTLEAEKARIEWSKDLVEIHLGGK